MDRDGIPCRIINGRCDHAAVAPVIIILRDENKLLPVGSDEERSQLGAVGYPQMVSTPACINEPEASHSDNQNQFLRAEPLYRAGVISIVHAKNILRIARKVGYPDALYIVPARVKHAEQVCDAISVRRPLQIIKIKIPSGIKFYLSGAVWSYEPQFFRRPCRLNPVHHIITASRPFEVIHSRLRIIGVE